MYCITLANGWRIEAPLSPSKTMPAAAPIGLPQRRPRRRRDVSYVVIVSRLLALFLLYLFGTLYYNAVEHWKPLDCVYFITVSISSIGYGAFHPTTDNSRIFTSFFVIFGIYLTISTVQEFASIFLLVQQNRFLKHIQVQYPFVNKISLSVFGAAFAMFIGTIVMALNEGWTAAFAWYWSVVTLTTIGYGDFTVHKDSSKCFIIAFIICCVLMFATALNNIVESQHELKSCSFWALLGRLFPQLVDNNGDGAPIVKDGTGDGVELRDLDGRVVYEYKDQLTASDFLLEMLIKTKKVDLAADLAPLIKAFAELDCEQIGYAERCDVDEFIARSCRVDHDSVGTSADDIEENQASFNGMHAAATEKERQEVTASLL
jgi:Ion channel